MPIAGALFGGTDFSNYFTLLGPIPADFKGDPASYAALKAAGVPMIGWGQFITVIVNFLILAVVVFLLIRQANKMMKKPDDAAAGPSEVELLTEIRDELRKR